MKNNITPDFSIIIKLLSVFISAWLLIHIFSLLGFFLALAYPMWWYLQPKKTVCLNCQIKGNGGYCSFCGESVQNSDFHPKNMRSVISNSLLITAFSLISIGAVYVENKAIRFFLPIEGNVSFLVEQPGKYRLNQIFPMEVNLLGITEPINTVRTDLSYDPRYLEIVNVSFDHSFASVFLESTYDNDIGFARLTGGTPNPGFSSEKAFLGTVYFKAKKAGTTEVAFLPSSLVLANDGKGTDVLKGLGSKRFLILPEDYDEYSKGKDQVLMFPEVLGDKIQEDDKVIYLYDNDPSVLGSQDSSVSIDDTVDVNESKDEKVGFFAKILKALIALDEKLLNLWHIRK